MPPAARDLFEKRSLDPQKLLVRRKRTTMGDTDRTSYRRHSAYKKFWSSFFKSLKKNDPGEPPPILKSWRNLYLVVLAHLIAWITFLAFFTRIFK
jgi:hypothetical protein